MKYLGQGREYRISRTRVANMKYLEQGEGI